MTIGDRIKQARQLRDMSRPQLAEAAHIKYPTLAGIENNDQAATTQLPSIAAALRVNIRWLQTGKGPMEAGTDVGPEMSDVVGIPAYAHSLALGDGSTPEEYAEAHRLMFRQSSLRRKGLHNRPLEVYYGRGESMEPRIRDGDAIMVDRSDTTPKDDCIFVLESDEGAVAKRLIEIDGSWFVVSDNKDNPKWRKPIPLHGKKPFRIVGRVRWIGSWEG
jgi:phage repressor protein C with HTH and peptisase S24 domain